jgi:DNA-3-methyladenine glycosylase II
MARGMEASSAKAAEPDAMPPELFRWFIATARPVSAALARDIEAFGPVWFPEREDHGTAAFLARSIVGQQISAKAAASIWSRIEAGAKGEGVRLAAFLAAADTARLRGCGLSGNKTKAILQIHAAEAAGGLAPKAGLRAMAHPDRVEQLCRIWGVGPWTCDMLAIFYCRDLDVWPEGDLAVQKVFRRYIGRRKPTKAAAVFAPYRSLLAIYMWRLAGAMWSK